MPGIVLVSYRPLASSRVLYQAASTEHSRAALHRPDHSPNAGHAALTRQARALFVKYFSQDMCRSWLINEIAIAAAYAVIALHYETKDDEKAAAGKPKALSEVAACVAMVAWLAARSPPNAAVTTRGESSRRPCV